MIRNFKNKTAVLTGAVIVALLLAGVERLFLYESPICSKA